MNILFYTILFLIGCVIGGEWAQKSYKIPKDLDMKKVHYNNNPKSEIVSNLTFK